MAHTPRSKPAIPAKSPASGPGGETHQQAGRKTAGREGVLTTNHGVAIADNQNSLKAGGRGPVLLEDFHLREKIFHFDHERIPERIVHWAGKLDVTAPEVLLAEPRKRWGSASSSGTVRINWRIIQAPISLVDYVVAHELTHLRHPDHTPEFWAALELVMPNYVARKAGLRALGPSLQW